MAEAVEDKLPHNPRLAGGLTAAFLVIAALTWMQSGNDSNSTQLAAAPFVPQVAPGFDIPTTPAAPPASPAVPAPTFSSGAASGLPSVQSPTPAAPPPTFSPPNLPPPTNPPSSPTTTQPPDDGGDDGSGIPDLPLPVPIPGPGSILSDPALLIQALCAQFAGGGAPPELVDFCTQGAEQLPPPPAPPVEVPLP